LKTDGSGSDNSGEDDKRYLENLGIPGMILDIPEMMQLTPLV